MPITHGQGNPDWSRDETILALDLVLRHWPKIPGKRSVEVKALSDLIRRLPLHADGEKNARFRNPDGVYLKLQNLASLHADKSGRKGLRTSQTDREVWRAFATRPKEVRVIAEQIAAGIDVLAVNEPGDDGDIYEAVEGMVLTRVHRVRERAPGFRSRIIERARKRDGVIRCECCSLVSKFDGAAAYVIFEVHHLVPLCNAATSVTRLQDLALLCANCHRLIHAVMRERASHCTLDEFRAWYGG
ncbi:MAG: hypothetical protein FLDDKLPJ_03679 [Phycisphaerae bacterium]|nr:hypothetical protein [Phycisphaerae bacterium]